MNLSKSLFHRPPAAHFFRALSTKSKKSKNIALNIQIGERDGDWLELLTFATASSSAFNHVNFSTAMSKLGRFRGHALSKMKDHDLYSAFIASVSAALLTPDHLSSFGGTREVTNIVHALVKLNEPSSAIMSKLNDQSSWLVSDGKPQEIANAAWSFATTGTPAPDLFEAIENRSSFLVSAGDPQAIANTAWAFAAMGVKAPKLFKAIEERAEFLATSCKPQEIANTAWAAATLNHPSPKLFAAIEKAVEKRDSFLVTKGHPQAISSTAWAFATTNTKAPALFKEIDLQAVRIAKNGSPQAIANTAWAAATLDESAPELFRAIEREGEFLVKQGKPQAISNTAWAFARMGVPAPGLFAAIERRAEFLVKDGGPQAAATTAWAFGKQRYDAPMLLGAVDAASEVLIKRGNTQCVSNAALAFAEIGHRPIAFFDCLENGENCDRFVKRANVRDINNVSWSLATLGLARSNEKLLQALWRRTIETDASEFLGDLLGQLVQIDVHARASGVTLPPAPPDLRTTMTQYVQRQTSTTSRFRLNFEDEYDELLTEAGFKHEREVSDAERSDENTA